MKILFTGGGTGGHFYPIIAVAESIHAIAEREHISDVELFFMSDAPFDKSALERNNIAFIPITAGKKRTYASVQNFIDLFKTAWGCVSATLKLFNLYPDVIFGKGGYASFPAMFAAKLLRIPVVIHESDIIPGRVNKWIAGYASHVAVSYPEATNYFKKNKNVVYTGQPIQREHVATPPGDAFELLHLEKGIPAILVVGGSQGAERINEELVDILPKLLESYQVIHQTGEKNFAWIQKRATGALVGSPNAGRYHAYGFLDPDQLRISAKASSVVISRAGSMIFEIALWGKPAILIPLPIARDDHQRENAYSYARTGAATVIEEMNLKPALFLSVIDSILKDYVKQRRMSEGTQQFCKPDAADKIATLLLSISSKHY